MENYIKKPNGGRGAIFHQGIKASIRQLMNKDICSMNADEKKQLTANILQLDLKDRKEDEINTLKQLTEQLDFFVKINAKKINQETKLQEKCCRRLKYESYQKGQTVIEYGAKADKFFIVLSGQVSIFLIKSQEALDIEEHQLKTGKKLNAWNGGLLNFNDEDEMSQKDEVNSPASSVASSNNVNRRDSYQMNSPGSRKYSSKLSIIRDSPRMSGQQEDKNLLQYNINQQENNNSKNNNDDSPQQLEKIIEKSKFSNFSPPLNKDKNQNAAGSFRIKLNFDEKIQELIEEENAKKLDTNRVDESENQIEQKNDNQNEQDNLTKENNVNENKNQINTQLEKRQMNQLYLKVDASSASSNLNKLRSASDVVSNNINNKSFQSPQSLTNNRTISRMTMLQQAIKNNAEGGFIFKKRLGCSTISELRQRLNQMSNTQDLNSVSSSSNTLSNLATPSKVSSSFQKSSLTQKNDIFTFLEDEKIVQLKQQVNQNGKNIIKKTRLAKLIDFYKNYDLFGPLQLSEIENAEKYFTDSGIFKYEYRDVIKAGSTFGELGILEGKPRSALIICSEDSEFAIMEKEDYSELLAERDRRKLLKKFEFLKQKIFPELTNDAIKKIFYSFQKRTIQKNETLFQEGDKVNGIFIIKYGEVNLSQKQKVEQQIPNPRDILAQESQINQAIDSPFTVQKKKNSLLYKPQKFIQKTFAVISNGEYFGEEDLLIKDNKQIRTFTATCSSLIGSVYYIEANAFLKFVRQKPTSFLVIQKRLNQKLQWRKEQKDKLNEHKKKFSLIDSFQQIEEEKIKQLVIRNNPKRSSMIELKSQTSSMILDTPSTTTPSIRTTTINSKQRNSSFLTLSNLEGSQTQLPSINRDLQLSLLIPQAKVTLSNPTCHTNMDRIWEEKSYDGSPKNSHLNSEKLIQEKNKSNFQSNPSNKMKTEDSNRFQNSPFYKSQRNSEINLQTLKSNTPKLQTINSDNIYSPLNQISKYLNTDVRSKSQTQTLIQDIEGLKKPVNLSKNIWQSVQKTRQTYQNYEINQDQKAKIHFQRQASIQFKTSQQISSQSSLIQIQSSQYLQTPEQLTSLTNLQQQTTSNSISESPKKRNLIDHQQKQLGLNLGSFSNISNQIYQYSQGFDLGKQLKKLPEIQSPQYKNENQLFKEQFDLEQKKKDIIRKTQFFQFKQQLKKKQILYENHNLQDNSDQKDLSKNALHIEIVQPNYQSIRSNSQTSSPQRKKGVNKNKKNGYVENIIKKVQGKSDRIDSILRLDELQQSKDQEEMDTELSNKFSEKSQITEGEEKKKGFQKYQILTALSQQEKIIYPMIQLQEDKQYQPRKQENQIENKTTNQLLPLQKSQSQPKIGGSFLKIEFYQKLKLNLLQSQQKLIQVKSQEQNGDSPNNFMVSNYQKINKIQQIN